RGADLVARWASERNLVFDELGFWGFWWMGIRGGMGWMGEGEFEGSEAGEELLVAELVEVFGEGFEVEDFAEGFDGPGFVEFAIGDPFAEGGNEIGLEG